MFLPFVLDEEVTGCSGFALTKLEVELDEELRIAIDPAVVRREDEVTVVAVGLDGSPHEAVIRWLDGGSSEAFLLSFSR